MKLPRKWWAAVLLAATAGLAGTADATTLAALSGDRTLTITDADRARVVREVQVGVSGRLIGIDVQPGQRITGLNASVRDVAVLP